MKRFSVAWATVLLCAGCLGCSGGTQEVDAGAAAGGNNDGSSGGSAAQGMMGSSGSGAGKGAASGPDQDDTEDACGSHVVHNERVTPDILIVLDRSGSMAATGNPDEIDRWSGSVAGIKKITAKLDGVIRFGLMMFPNAQLPDICAPGQNEVEVAIENSGPIAEALGRAQPGGFTPTATSLAVAHEYLGASLGPDVVPPPRYVLLVTDGAPNCAPGADLAYWLDQASGNVDEGAVLESVKEISALAADRVNTYVLGFGTKTDVNLSAALDSMAAAGGTGQKHHRAIEDDASLLKELTAITSNAISCDYVLTEAPERPDFVKVKLDQHQLNLDAPHGWSLGQDGKTVSVRGDACAALKDGKDHVLEVEVTCEIVGPI